MRVSNLTHRSCIRVTLGAALLVVAPLTANAGQPTVAIRECAKASTIRSTIDPKKPDAKKKQAEADRWLRRCEKRRRELAEKGPTPPPPPPPPPPPRKIHVAKKPPPSPPVLRRHPRNEGNSGPTARQRMGGYPVAVGSGQQRQNGNPGRPRPYFPPVYYAAPNAAQGLPPAAVSQAQPTQPIGTSAAPDNSQQQQYSLLGIGLGTTLTQGDCADGSLTLKKWQAYEAAATNAPTPVTASCQQTDDQAAVIARRILGVGPASQPDGIQFSLMRLAADSCPTWVSGGCTLSVATQSGIVVGLAFLTLASGEKDAVIALKNELGAEPVTQKSQNCGTSAKTATGEDKTDYLWKHPEVRATYTAQGKSCAQGRVRFESPELTTLLEP